MAGRRPRIKADGTLELPETRCPRCSTVNMGINATKGSYYCWVCSKGGPLGPRALETLIRIPTEAKSLSPSTLGPLPDTARRFIERRGLDPKWLEARYLVRWDGERLYWPAGQGASRRAIWPWEEPKTLTVSPRGLIGQHLLTKGARVVVTEGDLKAASIPLPWIGVGILGPSMSPDQALAIQSSEPSEVVVMLDGGMRRQAEKILEILCPLPARVVDSFPVGAGPDDVARETLYGLLGGW